MNTFLCTHSRLKTSLDHALKKQSVLYLSRRLTLRCSLLNEKRCNIKLQKNKISVGNVGVEEQDLVDTEQIFCGLSKRKQPFSLKKHDSNSYKAIRPLLLYCSRGLITAICKYVKMPVYPDKSNRSIQYSRNRIRKQILPVLQLFLNPRVEDILFGFAQFVFKEQEMLARLLWTVV